MFIERAFTFIPGMGCLVDVWNKMSKQHTMATFGSLITKDQVASYKAGSLAWDAFPDLNKAEREFIVSGMTQLQQTDFFGIAHIDDVMRPRQHVLVWKSNRWALR